MNYWYNYMELEINELAHCIQQAAHVNTIAE